MMDTRKVAVIGAGSFGTALSVVLSDNGFEPFVWDIDADNIAKIREEKENKRFLPGVELPGGIRFTEDKKLALDGAGCVLFAVPAQHFEDAFRDALPLMKGDPLVVNVAKGISRKGLRRMSEIAFSCCPSVRYVALSGPSHAEEVGRRMPTTVTVASNNISNAFEAQDIFMNDYLRIYTHDDLVGVELGGSLKNIIALGAGIADGLGFGDNAKAAMMTRGMVEITRLGVTLGARAETFYGLSGVGDLIVTCCSMHSRNRRCGILIGQGVAPDEAVKQVGMVVEGIYTAEAAYDLSERLGVDMPITRAIHDIIDGKLAASDAGRLLMTRKRKSEMNGDRG